VTLLLALDQVELYPAGELDAHGWRQPGTVPVWAGLGNLQQQPGHSDPQATAGGGHGPHDPRRDRVGVLYLPADAPLVDGITAEVNGQPWALSQTRIVRDPTGGPLDCWAATATGTWTWEHGGAGPEPEPELPELVPDG
jgi:hypothetical protein